tara:strand:+ start:89 stop:1063 length:975 start_codon:yes stop_codon:yes gene_type:complete
MPSIDDGYGNAKTSRNRTSTNSGGRDANDRGNGDGRARFAAAQAARLRAEAAAKAKAKKAKAKPSRPATPIASTAKAFAAPQANIIQTQNSGLTSYNSGPSKVPSYSQGDGQMSPALAAKQNKKPATSPAYMRGEDEFESNVLGISSTKSATKSVTKPITSISPQQANLPSEDKGYFQSFKEAVGLLFDDPRTEESGRYNQKYWAERLAEGKKLGNKNIQAEIAAEQARLGGPSQSYTQEKVPGYFEPLNHPSQKKIATLPKPQNVQKEIEAIDNQIANETDPVKLKEAHRRRLMLMRMSRTNTRFAGMLGEADTKRTNLMSIS